jgi:hypothetical protein
MCWCECSIKHPPRFTTTHTATITTINATAAITTITATLPTTGSLSSRHSGAGEGNPAAATPATTTATILSAAPSASVSALRVVDRREADEEEDVMPVSSCAVEDGVSRPMTPLMRDRTAASCQRSSTPAMLCVSSFFFVSKSVYLGIFSRKFSVSSF